MRRQAATVSFMLAAIFGFAALAGGARGQAAPTQANPTSQAPATSSNSQVAQSAVPATTAAPDSATPSKRVWTNDDVGDLRRDSPISTVGVANAKAQKPVGTKQMANPETIRSYHNRILALQAKLPPIDSQIADLQGVLNGQTVNSTRHTGAKIDDWHDELTRLQQQKSDLETKISAMQDEARHKGVPENQIPE